MALIMQYLTYLIVLLILFKYVLFILSFLPIRLFISYKNKKETESLTVKKLMMSNDYPVTKIGLVKNIKNQIRLTIEGYTRYVIIKIGMIPSYTIRKAIYTNVFFVKIEPKAHIYYGAEIRDPSKLVIGEGSVIGDKAILDARKGIIIGKNVNISSEVCLWTLQHDYNDSYFRTEGGSIIIEDRVWLGPRVTVLPNIVIGEGAVIGGGALVTKDVEPYCLYAGIPAKKIGERNRNLKYEFKGNNLHFY